MKWKNIFICIPSIVIVNQDFLLSINNGFKKMYIQIVSFFFAKYLLFRIICEKYYMMTKKKKRNREIILYAHIGTFNYILMEILLSASIITGTLLSWFKTVENRASVQSCRKNRAFIGKSFYSGSKKMILLTNQISLSFYLIIWISFSLFMYL